MENKTSKIKSHKTTVEDKSVKDKSITKKKDLKKEIKQNSTSTSSKVLVKDIHFEGEYIRAVGRRKSSIATVRILNEKGAIFINEKPVDNYFNYKIYGDLIVEPLKLVGANGKFKITIRVKGGGKRGQVDAIRLGIARALVKLDPDLRKTLKSNGLLSRDPRVKERKKPGLKRARKAPQWSKR